MLLPAWATKELLWKIGPPIMLALAIGAAVLYIDHRGYKRAEGQAKLSRALEQNTRLKLKVLVDGMKDELEQDLQDVVSKTDSNMGKRIGDLRIREKIEILPLLQKEIDNDPRFRDPSLGITDGMLRAINTARATSDFSTCTRTADGGITCSLPESSPAER